MRGDTYRVLKIGFAPQRWVSFVVQRAASGVLGFVSNMCSMCPHHQVCIRGGVMVGGRYVRGMHGWCDGVLMMMMFLLLFIFCSKLVRPTVFFFSEYKIFWGYSSG